MANPRVLIGIPTHGTICNETRDCLDRMREISPRFDVVKVHGSILPQNRLEIVRTAFELGSTHIFWLDSDMIFRPDALNLMLKHEKEFVAGNCVTKTVPAKPTARRDKDTLIHTNEKSSGLEQCKFIGLAVALTKVEIFRRIPQPWFDIIYHPEADCYEGEDWFFCRKARDHGVKLYIDHDVSKSILHIGSLYYGHHLVEPQENAR